MCQNKSTFFPMPTFPSLLISKIVPRYQFSSDRSELTKTASTGNSAWTMQPDISAIFHFDIYFHVSSCGVVRNGVHFKPPIALLSTKKCKCTCEVMKLGSFTQTNSRAHNVYLNDSLFTMHCRAAAKTF